MNTAPSARTAGLTSLALLAIPLSVAASAETGAAATTYDGTDVLLLVAYLGSAIALSFLCSVAEAVLLSITPSYIVDLKAKRPKLGLAMQRLRQDNVDQSLAAILTLNTIAHTAGAVGSGAKATVVFGSAWVGVFSAIATLLILFLSEIIPKTLGAVHWRQLAAPTAFFVRGLIVILYPLIRVSELLTRLVSGGKQTHVFSRDEFIAMAGVGEESGQIDPRESRILRNLFRMSTLRARDVMTPRPVMVALQRDMSISEALETTSADPFSRIPIYAADMDGITGFVLKDEMLQAEANDEGGRALHTLSRELPSVPDSMPLSNLLEFLLDRRQQIALVVGEYGDTQGLVTLEDVVETLLGNEIVDEMDRVTDMRHLARQRWKRRAAARGLQLPPNTEPD
ncbi:hemolysin family protein [Marilutibacter alkalisoli]|uniref:HlyC/CorC family transporter n=1 Tax=Marilutibacter alkalisoli TaxID=2591633 RepID=A0A514BQ06_9GAMM|nr:hemolysin family protein [Lysobacter alkalisoli]QDH69470.1 HlyC/CorC family transporter [Lysobacter alkalisoli]